MENEVLQEVESRLDLGDLDGAQSLLATADPFYRYPYAIAYLTTRLLYLRGRLNRGEAAERLREIRVQCGDPFPELERWLEDLEMRGGRSADDGARPSANPRAVPNQPRLHTPPLGSSPPVKMTAKRGTAREAARGRGATQPIAHDRDALPGSPIQEATHATEIDLRKPEFPKAPVLPDFGARKGARSTVSLEMPAVTLSARAELPENAGRYSAAPGSTESLRPSSPPLADRTPDESRDRIGDSLARAALATLDDSQTGLESLPPSRVRELWLRAPAGAALLPQPAAEAALVVGDRIRAVGLLAQLAAHHVSERGRPQNEEDPVVLAAVAQTFLGSAPVFAEFGPYDFSLFSIMRTEAALDLLLGTEPWTHRLGARDPMLTLLGAYIGETLRLCHQGTWEHYPGDLERARVVVGYKSWYPFQLLTNRYRFGASARLKSGLTSALSYRQSPPWQHRVPGDDAPRPPWGDLRWPPARLMPELARALEQSSIALYATSVTGLPLDLSAYSVVGLDAYLSLIAPPGSHPADNPRAVERLAIWVGAYLGEMLCRAGSGSWVERQGRTTEPDERSYVVQLGNRSETTPVVEVLARLRMTSKRRLSDYVHEQIGQNPEISPA